MLVDPNQGTVLGPVVRNFDGSNEGGRKVGVGSCIYGHWRMSDALAT